jgi:hypothetical protein
MTFKGQIPIMNKTVVDNISEQVNTFTYLGCKISCEPTISVKSI